MGLHILGQPLTGTLLVDGILQMLRLSNGDMPSIYDLFAEKYGVTLDDIQQHAGDMVEAQGITGGQLMDKIRKEAKTVIETLASGSLRQKRSLLPWRFRRLKAVMHGGRR